MNYHLLVAKQQPYRKACLLAKNNEEFSGERSDEWANRKKKIERAMGVGRRTREETAKWNQMTALIFQTGEGGGGEGSHIPGLATGNLEGHIVAKQNSSYHKSKSDSLFMTHVTLCRERI